MTGILHGETLKALMKNVTLPDFAFLLTTPKRSLDLAAANLQDFLMWTSGITWVLENNSNSDQR